MSLKQDVFLPAGYCANGDIVLESRDSVLPVKESTVLIEYDKTYMHTEVSEQQVE